MAYLINKRQEVVFSAGYSRLMCMVAYRHSRNKRCGEGRNGVGRRRSESPNVEWEKFRWREVGGSPVNFVTRSTVREVMVVESVSRWSPRVPCTPRNACHIVRENSRAGKGESGIGCRLSNVGVGPYLRETQRKKSWDRVDYPDKRAYTPEVIWGFEC